jgi:integrase
MATIRTAKQAEAAKPGRHRVEGADGLYLSVRANGGGSWIFRYNAGKNAEGKPIRREMGLGSRIDIAIDDARQRAKKLAVQHDEGQDPIEARQQARATAKKKREASARRVTFERAASSYLDANAPTWKHRYARAAWQSVVRRYALPVLGGLVLDNITSDDVAAAMTQAEAAGEETARRLRPEIFKVIERARALGQFDAQRLNPANAHTMRHAKPMRRRGERQGFRTVPLKRAPAIFRQLQEKAQSEAAFAVWVFMIATAVRPSEALKATWSEIDLDEGRWAIPGVRMKKGRTHVVPLNSIAREVLRRQAKIRRNGFVFPGPMADALSYDTFAKATGKAGLDAGSPHGWRSVFRDWAGDICKLENKSELAEFALAHVLGQTEAAYRRSTGDRKPLMEAYAQWLGTDGTDVVPYATRV